MGGGKKKAQDPFLKKEWYKLIAPSMFAQKECGKTIITRTQGQKIASDGLKGRIVELSLADLNNNEAMSYRKVKLCVEDVQGYNCLLNFHGMDMTRDKLCSLIKKKQSIIEGNVDARTTDGYVVRMFCIAFTKKQDDQLKETCYAKSAKVRSIREKWSPPWLPWQERETSRPWSRRWWQALPERRSRGRPPASSRSRTATFARSR